VFDEAIRHVLLGTFENSGFVSKAECEDCKRLGFTSKAAHRDSKRRGSRVAHAHWREKNGRLGNGGLRGAPVGAARWILRLGQQKMTPGKFSPSVGLEPRAHVIYTVGLAGTEPHL
jgi:hypothetical protein